MTIRAVVVVVPARDEATTLPACLRGVERAAATLDHVRGVVVAVAVPSDDGATLASLRATTTPAVDLRAVPVPPATSVGGARHAAVEVALAAIRRTGVDPSDTWIATTDADSIVPPEWLATHVELADTGADCVVGLVTVADWGDHPASARAAWEREYVVADDHPHVHGANLGVRASTYLATGGFPDRAVHEDVALVRAVAGRGVVARTSRARVATSARTDNRVPGGFGGHLRGLAS